MGFAAKSNALDHLNILQTRQDLVLNSEYGFHAECDALFDGERLLLQMLDSTRGLEVNDDVGASLDLRMVIYHHGARGRANSLPDQVIQ